MLDQKIQKVLKLAHSKGNVWLQSEAAPHVSKDVGKVQPDNPKAGNVDKELENQPKPRVRDTHPELAKATQKVEGEKLANQPGNKSMKIH